MKRDHDPCVSVIELTSECIIDVLNLQSIFLMKKRFHEFWYLLRYLGSMTSQQIDGPKNRIFNKSYSLRKRSNLKHCNTVTVTVYNTVT